MTFVPIFVAPSPPPSPRARELARELRERIEDYRRRERGTTDNEIRQALRLAVPSGAFASTAAAVVAGLVGVLVLLGVVFLGRAGGAGVPFLAVAVAGIGFVVGVVAILLKARGG